MAVLPTSESESCLLAKLVDTTARHNMVAHTHTHTTARHNMVAVLSRRASTLKVLAETKAETLVWKGRAGGRAGAG